MVLLRCFCWINYLLLLVPLLDTSAAIKPDSSFSNYYVTHPRVYHAREKRSLSSSADSQEQTGHLRELVVELNLAGKNVTLDLKLNRGLIPKGYFEEYQKDGNKVVRKPNLKDEKMELCHYHGSVRNIENSWVAISTCDGIKGVVYDGNELHYVENADRSSGTGSLNGAHLVYRHSDLASNFSCGTRDDPLPSGHNHRIDTATSHRFKRSSPYIRGPYNANRQSRFIELILVVDHKFFTDYDSDINKINQRCKDLANVINSLYQPLNIFVALVGVVIWNERDEFYVDPNGDKTLNNFLDYRRTKLNVEYPNDNAQFVTRRQFDANVVGKALKGPICTYKFSGGVNVDHSPNVGLVATTIAHEMGHNLGMEHDNEKISNCVCPKDRCIMSPSSSSLSPTDWSSCSKDYLAFAFEHGMDYCMLNKPASLFDGPVCGNGFVEPGEDCDCGLEEHCTSVCCDPTTCKLFENATCATGECCDLQTCKLRDPGTECRDTGNRECDLPEYCNGESEYCPDDVFRMDGDSCGGGTAYCFQGNCKSHTSQCRLLWGPSGTESDKKCYSINKNGSLNGNCGYDRPKETYTKCAQQDVECGLLQCKHYTEKLEFGMESAAVTGMSYVHLDGNIISCRTATIDLGLNVKDPGLAPDGAKCGKNHMCYNQKCIPADYFRTAVHPNACPNNCNGNGVCNSEGNCHCYNGYAPPDCDSSGVGGSLNSGPADNPINHNKLRTIFWYMMLALIPLVLVLLLYPHYIRKSPSYFWKRNQRRTVLCEKTVHTKVVNVTIDGISGPRQSLVSGEAKPKTGRDEPTHSSIQDSLLGNFKGFSILPLAKSNSPPPTIASPLRPAPASPPAAPSVTSPKIARVAPTLPPPPSMQLPQLPPQNRPLISSPVLDNTTSTAAKKLINTPAGLDKKPVHAVVPVVRAAPAPPTSAGGNAKPLSPKPIESPSEKPMPKEPSNATLSRIASLISKAQPGGTTVAPKAATERREGAQKAAKIDRNTLKRLKISDPIPINEPSIPVEPLPMSKEQESIMRTQSMRHTKKKQCATIHSFGSMRLPPGAARPPSLVGCSRPTSPPPRPPPIPGNLPGTTAPEMAENIYAVIEETPAEESQPANPSKGLLDEIVNEMQARNLASICKPEEKLYVNSGSGENSGEYLKPIKSASSAAPSADSGSASVVKLSVPEKSAPGFRPVGSKKPNPPVFKPAVANSSQAGSSVSAAISKYNSTLRKSTSPARKSTSPARKSTSPASKSTLPTSKTKPLAKPQGSGSATEAKEAVKLPKTSHVASIHKKFEAQSRFVPGKRGTMS